MAFTRNDLCVRVLGLLNRLDVDNPPSAGDIQLVNRLIESSVDRLLKMNLIRRDPTTGNSTIDVGTPSNLTSGSIGSAYLVALARVITRDVAIDFGANPDDYDKMAAQGEDTFAKLRFKADGQPPAASGVTSTRLGLIYETLRQLGIVSINEQASPDAIDLADRLIDRTLSELRRKNIYAALDSGTYASTGTGAFPESDVMALAQVMTRPAAMAFPAQSLKGQVSEYIQLAGDGEERLRQMKDEIDLDEPIYFRDY